MIYKEYGNTGKKVSAIGFGGMRIDPNNEEEAIKTVRKAYERGVNYYDTAPGYCDDRSEELIGKGIQDFKDDIYLSTKSNLNDDPEPSDVRERLETSLKRLGVDKIHFYHMWCIMDMEHFEKVIADGGPYEGALRAKEEGLIDHICFSTHARGEEISKMVKSGLFEGVTLGFNILNWTNRIEGIRAASEEGIGVTVMNPLGGGMIPAGADRFSFLCNEGESVVEAALKFTLNHPGITITLAGMGNPDEVIEDTGVVDKDFTVDKDKMEAFREKFEEFGESFCTTCRYCLPCPADIGIPYMMRAFDWFKLDDEEKSQNIVDFALENEPLGPGKPSECTECGYCEEHCTRHLEIIDRMDEVAERFE